MTITEIVARKIWGSMLIALRRSPVRRAHLRRKLRQGDPTRMQTFFANASKRQEMFAIRYGRRMITWALNLFVFAATITFAYATITELQDRGWLTLSRDEIAPARHR